MMGILTIANHYIFYRAGLNVWWLTDYLNHPQLSEVDWFGVLELKRKAILWGYGSSTTSSSTSGEVVVEEEGRREK